jgi:hypothetical protein
MKSDKKISDTEWNTHLKKYKTKYRVRPDEIGIYNIICRVGQIQTYSIRNGELCFTGEYKSGKGVANIKRAIPKYCTITQEGDTDIVVKFPEEKLTSVEEIFKPRKKRVMSEENKEKCRERLKKWRNKNDM